jgi:hypothetical protein
MLIPIQKELEMIMEVTKNEDNILDFIKENRFKWSWCDALFMSPPTFARLAKVTGKQKYLDYLHEWWWKVSDYYYDTEEHLYFRDQKYMKDREPNGRKIFWSRGNGWVLGGLVRVLQYLPKEDPERPKYEKQLQEMCTALANIQAEDGLWHSGLLDPVAHTQSETSGSAFFVYGLAYAMSENIIDKEQFAPILKKAWIGLLNYVGEDGGFSGVQPMDEKPGKYDENSIQPFGTGAFLLAASEVYRLADLFVKEPVLLKSPITMQSKPLELSDKFRRLEAPGTNRKAIQLTEGTASAYPMYYFIPSITKDGKYLVYHRYENKEVQLWRLNLKTSETVQMTFYASSTEDNDWLRWQTEPGLKGVYDFRSVVNVERGTVVYFENNTAHQMDIETLEDQVLFTVPEGREVQGQNCVSPDGKLFIYIDRPAGVTFRGPCIGAKLVAYNFDTKEHKVLCVVNHAIHHTLPVDNERFMIHHPPGHNGMIMTDLSSGVWTDLRWGDKNARGTVVHAVTTEKGIAFEASGIEGGMVISGLYDPFTRRRLEFLLPSDFGYSHTGYDPTGNLWFYETNHKKEGHSLWYMEELDPVNGGVFKRLTGDWKTYSKSQRGHFHPQLTPDRRWILFTGGDPKTQTDQLFLLDISNLDDTKGIDINKMSISGQNSVMVPGKCK